MQCKFIVLVRTLNSFIKVISGMTSKSNIGTVSSYCMQTIPITAGLRVKVFCWYFSLQYNGKEKSMGRWGEERKWKKGERPAVGLKSIPLPPCVLPVTWPVTDLLSLYCLCTRKYLSVGFTYNKYMYWILWYSVKENADRLWNTWEIFFRYFPSHFKNFGLH